MPARKRQARVRQLTAKTDFLKKLTLNQWLLGRFGIDALEPYRDGGKKVRPLTMLAKTLKDVNPGLTADRHHHYLHALLAVWQPEWRYDQTLLKRFDANIVEHTDSLNQQRIKPIQWKYFQWLSLLFVEIYLHEYFRDRDALLQSLNDQVQRFNQLWNGKGYQTGIGPYQPEDLNKLCLQNATGSGKTLLMHTNIRQFRHHAWAAGCHGDYSQIILVTPNERLSEQHLREFEESSLEAERLSQDGGDLFAGDRKALRRIAVTEISKLGAEQGKKVMAADSFGDNNLLLVDEGHRGLGSAKEERGWLAQRNKLAGRGFTFEYSATFKEAVVAAKDAEVEASYARNILFDYGYRYFYEDGFGKDYRIFNLPTKRTQHQRNYLTAALLTFYQQQRLYVDNKTGFQEWNLSAPLWVFVGASVIKDDGKAETPTNYKERASDVAKVLEFLAWFAGEREQALAAIRAVFEDQAGRTGLLDKDNNDIFGGSFTWLKEQGIKSEALYRDVLAHTFRAPGGGTLIVDRITGDSGELLLRCGEAEQPFGLINVGDAPGLAAHLESQDLNHIEIRKSEFAEASFAEVHKDTSPVNILIGSRKFIEGWNAWRVASMGLMNTGKKEGSQIIQLFGRGVRLKGRDMSLMRSSRLDPARAPRFLHLLETLNVFGVGADFMETFRQFLEDEGLPGNDNPEVFTLPLNVTQDIGKELKILRPKVRRDSQQQYNFQRHGPLIRFGHPFGARPHPMGLTPDIAEQGRKIVLDRYPRVQDIQAEGVRVTQAQGGEVRQRDRVFDGIRLGLLDRQRLFLDLDRYVRQRGYANLMLDSQRLLPLLQDRDWYQLLIPDDLWQPAKANIRIWHQTALELLSLLADRVFNYHRRAWLEPRMELVTLDQSNDNLPDTDEYHLIVDGSESALIDDIKKLKKEIEANQSESYDSPLTGGASALRFGIHLYNPLLHLGSDSRIRIEPVALNDSEFQFVKDLSQWLKRNQKQLTDKGQKLFLLRNLVRHGVGFFEAGNFYPDFILWLVEGKKQKIIFVDPHGLRMESKESDKVQLYRKIKNVEKRLNDPDVTLESCLIAPPTTSKHQVQTQWGCADADLEALHLFFMADAGYLDAMTQRFFV